MLKGIGEATEEIDNMLAGKHEMVHTPGWCLREFIRETRVKGATPIVCSLIPRDNWKDGHMQRSPATWAGWATAVVVAEHAPFLDLDNRIAERYGEVGQARFEP